MIDKRIETAKKELDKAKERLTNIQANRGGYVFLSDVMEELELAFGNICRARAFVDMSIEEQSVQ